MRTCTVARVPDTVTAMSRSGPARTSAGTVTMICVVDQASTDAWRPSIVTSPSTALRLDPKFCPRIVRPWRQVAGFGSTPEIDSGPRVAVGVTVGVDVRVSVGDGRGVSVGSGGSSGAAYRSGAVSGSASGPRLPMLPVAARDGVCASTLACRSARSSGAASAWAAASRLRSESSSRCRRSGFSPPPG
jgi:hypothetical protein